MNILKTIYRFIFPVNLDDLFSEERQEEAALKVAARISRGNTNMQDTRVVTDRVFEKQMAEYAHKVECKQYSFLR